MNDNEVAHAVLYGVLAWGLAFFVGLLHWAQEFINPPRPLFVWWVGAVKASTAGVMGLLAALLCVEAHLDLTLSIVAVVLAGWGGAEALNVLKDAAVTTLVNIIQRGGANGGQKKD